MPKPRTVTFHDYTLLANSEILSHRVHDSAKLARPAVGIFAPMIGVDGHQPIPYPGLEHIDLLFSGEHGNAYASFYSRGQIVTTSILLSGANPGGEAEILAGLDTLIMNYGAPAPGLTITQRPLIVSVPLAMSEDIEIVADMETCLAAAYFERYA